MNEILSTQAMYGDILTGNPLIDALPKQLTLQQLYSKLMCVPELANNYKKLPPQERYILTENINKLFIPLDFAAIVYNLLYTGIRSSYQGKTIRSIIQRLNEFGQYIFYRMPNTLKDSTTQAECFSVLGESGMGKTQTITRILDLFPQVIHHTEYDGHPFEHDQIVYIKIESPANNSPRGACLQILSAIDDILGTDLCVEERKRSSNLDMLTTRIAQACTRYSVGCIVIDEIHDMRIAQHFASTNRHAIVDVIVKNMGFHVADSFTTVHNYIDLDNMILRKGAVSAQVGERLIIPINMRDGSLVCVGKGNPKWNYSAPHGAGRLMSRADAKQSFTVSEFKKEMDGIFTTSVGRDTLDECPMAYKPIEAIMDNIGDTVDVQKIIRPIYNFKAGGE